MIEGSQCAFGSCALGPKSGVQLSVCGRGSGGTVASDPQNARKLHKRILKTVYTSYEVATTNWTLVARTKVPVTTWHPAAL